MVFFYLHHFLNMLQCSFVQLLQKPMPSLLNSLFCILLPIPVITHANIIIYQSIGTHGEIRLTQTPPNQPYQILTLHHPTNTTPSATKDAHLMQQCRLLKDNLQALNAGGIIQEIDAQGKTTTLTAEQITVHKAQTEQALKTHCS